jgi:hypothetical protein
MENLDEDAVNEAITALDGWIDRNGWAGYDPYDIRGQDWYQRLFGAQNRLFRKVRGALALAEAKLPPDRLRQFLRVKKEINAKGMGLLASAYLSRFVVTNDRNLLARAEEILDWLRHNRCNDYPGSSWGYPFHWQSRIFLPRGTPSVVVTATVGDAWIDHYQLTREPASLEIAAEIARFFVQGLNRPVDDDDRICFSYTPLDRFKVHNANLFAAAFLARLCAITEDSELGDMALRAVRYTLSEQNPGGSFFYWGSEPPTIIDHYHTGFVLRHLDTVRESMAADFIDAPLRRAYDFYLNRLFTDQGTPKFTPNRLYPIDIHSCAEAILCLCQLGPRLGGIDGAAAVFELTQSRMRAADGWYIAALRLNRRRETAVRIPYMRWGQAWMMLALSRLQARLRLMPAN